MNTEELWLDLDLTQHLLVEYNDTTTRWWWHLVHSEIWNTWWNLHPDSVLEEDWMLCEDIEYDEWNTLEQDWWDIVRQQGKEMSGE